MEEDEPIRSVTKEEFEALRASIIASREADRAKQSAPAQSELTKSESAPSQTSGELFSQSSEQESAKQQVPTGGEVTDPPSPQALELGAEIWELRKKGVQRLRGSHAFGNSAIKR
jgi:hypothetical protein